MKIFKQDARRITTQGRRGTIVTNPPYGERLGERAEVEQLYREIGRNFKNFEPWHIYVITSCEYFEKLYGRRADKSKKLYNGMLPCTLYQFFKPQQNSFKPYDKKPFEKKSFDKKPYDKKPYEKKSFDKSGDFKGNKNNKFKK
jgi:hypothetical protein